MPVALQQEPREEKLSSTAGAGAGNRPIWRSQPGPVGLPSPTSRHRNSREACAVSQQDPQGSRWIAGGQSAVGWHRAVVGDRVAQGWHNPTRDAAQGAPHASCSSAGRVPSGYFAGTAKRSTGKQIRSKARLKNASKLPVPQAGCAAEPSPARPRVPAAPNYTAGPGGPGPAQLRGAGPAPAAGKNGIVMAGGSWHRERGRGSRLRGWGRWAGKMEILGRDG